MTSLLFSDVLISAYPSGAAGTPRAGHRLPVPAAGGALTSGDTIGSQADQEISRPGRFLLATFGDCQHEGSEHGALPS